jgi:signal recognition particle receptor subunit beta
MKQIKKIKVVIAGPFAAGKTQFINTVSEIKTVKTEKRIQHSGEKHVKDYTTVAMDFGKIRIDDEHELYLFGTPGQFRFDFMWEILGEGALGVIVLVDSTDPINFPRGKKDHKLLPITVSRSHCGWCEQARPTQRLEP